MVILYLQQKISLPASAAFADGSSLVVATAAMMAWAGVTRHACAVGLVTHVAWPAATTCVTVSMGHCWSLIGREVMVHILKYLPTC
jgi:hypothetical protein